MASRKSIPLAVCSALLLVIGCSDGGVGGGDRKSVYPVKGKITMNGAPVAGATVTFSPQSEQPVAYGRTNSSGEYALTTYDANDGAAEGEYVVLVSKSVSASSSESSGQSMHDAMTAGASGGGAHGGGSGQAEESGSLLPEKYSSQADSGLKATVSSSGDNNFDFDLQP